MNILHIASFIGNIGDNANHKGLRSCLERAFPEQCPQYTELEIRKCYRIYTGADRWAFDEQFVELANAHDLIVIGGGNFFEPWLTESASGTTIDLSLDVLDQIQSPLVFFGVGFDTYKSCPSACLARFLTFSEYLQQRPNTLLSFRNDGSFDNYVSSYGVQAAHNILTVPDGAFFYQPNADLGLIDTSGAEEYWGINVASDMKDVRFPGGGRSLTWEQFLDNYAGLLSTALEERDTLRLILFPHIYKDLSAIGELLDRIDDRFCRDRIVVAPYLYGWEGADKLFSLYDTCALIMGMRFHTNVCAMAMDIPAIGLSSSPKLFDLYADLNLSRRCIDVKNSEFVAPLKELISSIENNALRIKRENIQLKDTLEKQMGRFILRLREMI